MPYTTEIVKLLTDQLAKFVTLNRHHLVGQVANLEFWLGEVQHGLAVIGGYNNRFDRLRSAQRRHVAEHGTTEFRLEDPLIHGPPSPPRRVPDGQMREARNALREATYRFLVRFYKEGLISERSVRQACGDLGIGVEASDLRSHG